MAREARGYGWRIELAGAMVVFIVGSLLHFAYAWSGEQWLVAIFSAVNESTWEHLKIAFWPGLFWAASRAAGQSYSAGSYWSSRGFGLLAVSVLIVVVFYGYTAILGRNILALDIGVFAISILAGHAVGVCSVTLTSRSSVVRRIGLLLLVTQIAAFGLFTYWPPRHVLFEDPRNGLHGLPAYSTQKVPGGTE